MDTSETFIEMCEKAKEIQALRPKASTLENGDFYWRSYMGEAVPSRYQDGVKVMMQILDYTSPLDGYRCWLPRQDQLQEMMRPAHPSFDNPFSLLDEFHGSINDYEWYSSTSGLSQEIDGWKPSSYFNQFTSMEQLWLAFVMKQLYNKVWDGEQWIKEVI